MASAMLPSGMPMTGMPQPSIPRGASPQVEAGHLLQRAEHALLHRMLVADVAAASARPDARAVVRKPVCLPEQLL